MRLVEGFDQGFEIPGVGVVDAVVEVVDHGRVGRRWGWRRGDHDLCAVRGGLGCRGQHRLCFFISGGEIAAGCLGQGGVERLEGPGIQGPVPGVLQCKTYGGDGLLGQVFPEIHLPRP